MKVLGFNDEITTCDCCGKRNLRGTFAIETDGGDTLFYGSVCVGRVYGKRRAKEISFLADKISRTQAGTWDQAIDKLSRGMLQPFMGYVGDRPAMDNRTATMAAVTSIRDCRTGQVIRERAA